MNYKETAKGILEHVGGVENISNMSIAVNGRRGIEKNRL